MGLLDNLAKALAKPLAELVTAEQNRIGVNVALERKDEAAIPFTPGNPIIPSSINYSNAQGRPEPRRFEYNVATNLNITEQRLIPFKTLRVAADQIDILRRCIEVLKAKAVGLEWDIVLTSDAVEQVAAEKKISNLRAAQVAKELYGDEIARARDFWRVPDKQNGLVFADWLNQSLEEILVLDAWAVWPQENLKGELIGLQVVAGDTIKPLIDSRGMRPVQPYPAFQQILYGFPRNEFSAPDEDVEADGEFNCSQMSYMVRNRRTNSVYGFSPTERSLGLADIYLRRQQWLRAEFTDGVMPAMFFETDATFGNNPDLLRAYENVFNDELSGQTEQRKRARLLPAGIKPSELTSYEEKFSDAFDEFLVTSIAGHYGVQPSEIGFHGKTGMGGSSLHQGQAESSEVIGLIPLVNWVATQLTQMSHVYAGMPRSLEFKFMPSARNDAEQAAKADDIRLKNGTLAINEARAKMGMSLLDAEEADTPIFSTTAGSYFITENGVMDFVTGTTVDSTDDTPTKPTPVPDATPEATPDTAFDAGIDEAKKFLRSLNKFEKDRSKGKRQTMRPFVFSSVPAAYAETLNKFVEVDDLEAARVYAEVYIR